MNDLQLYYVEAGPVCGIELAPNLDTARTYAAFEFGGRRYITLVRLATQDDIDYVRNMGGVVPSAPQAVQP